MIPNWNIQSVNHCIRICEYSVIGVLESSILMYFSIEFRHY